MSVATERIRSGREPVWVVQLGMDTCTLVYSVGACTAAIGVTGTEECFNTYATCQDIANFSFDVKLYNFCEPRAGIPSSAGFIPSIERVEISPTRIAPGFGLGVRATVRITFRDHPHHDIGVDDYVANRSYTPTEQGTFWGKFIKRNKFYQGRGMSVWSGYVTDPFDGGLATDFSRRDYIIDKIEGPDANGRVVVTGKDILKMADDGRAQAPVANSGVLLANILVGDGAATLSPAGVGNSEYSASGTLKIGSECITFTRIADALTLTARATDGTTADGHNADDSVQECLRYTSQEIDDVITDLLVNYAGVNAAFIDAAAWDAEVTDWLSGHTATALITEPTGVNTLLTELSQQYLFDLWWDETINEIRLSVLKPYDTAPILTEDSNIVADSLSVREDPSKRLSQVWIYYGVVNPTESLKESINFTTLHVRVDTNAEIARQYNEKRIKTYYSRWFTASGDALRLAARMLQWRRDNPRLYTFTLDAKDDYWTGDTVILDTSIEQTITGANIQTPVKIVETKEVAGGHSYRYKAVDEAFSGRYGRVAPNGMDDYDDASDVNIQRYAWVAENAAPQLNSDGPYLIV